MYFIKKLEWTISMATSIPSTCCPVQPLRYSPWWGCLPLFPPDTPTDGLLLSWGRLCHHNQEIHTMRNSSELFFGVPARCKIVLSITGNKKNHFSPNYHATILLTNKATAGFYCMYAGKNLLPFYVRSFSPRFQWEI